MRAPPVRESGLSLALSGLPVATGMAAGTGSVIVFLDIDGVLLPFGDLADVVPEGTLFPDRCLAALSRWRPPGRVQS